MDFTADGTVFVQAVDDRAFNIFSKAEFEVKIYDARKDDDLIAAEKALHRSIMEKMLRREEQAIMGGKPDEVAASWRVTDVLWAGEPAPELEPERPTCQPAPERGLALGGLR